MDEALISKTYRTILFTWAIAMAWALAYQKLFIAINITIGVITGTASLYSFDVFVRRVFVPGAVKPRPKLLLFTLAKYVCIAIMLYWLVHWRNANLMAFCGGIVLVHFALFAKMAGINIAERKAGQDSGAESPADISKES
jgi:hypothetical protein